MTCNKTMHSCVLISRFLSKFYLSSAPIPLFTVVYGALGSNSRYLSGYLSVFSSTPLFPSVITLEYKLLSLPWRGYFNNCIVTFQVFFFKRPSWFVNCHGDGGRLISFGDSFHQIGQINYTVTTWWRGKKNSNSAFGLRKCANRGSGSFSSWTCFLYN